MATVLFVCLHNAGNSQMGAALFEREANGRHQALSAGTAPAERAQPEVRDAMREIGAYLDDRVPRLLTYGLVEEADLIVKMGPADQCPHIPEKRYLDWNLPDPAGQALAEVRAIRDDISLRVQLLVASLDGVTLASA